MKKAKQTIVLLLIVLSMLAFQNAVAQLTVIHQNGFESNYGGWNNSGTQRGGGMTSQNDYPPNCQINYEGAYGVICGTGTSSITSPIFNTTAYSDIQMSFKLVAVGYLNPSGLVDGLDANDSIIIETGNGGPSWTRQLVVTGKKDAYWGGGALINAVTSFGTYKVCAPKFNKGGDIKSSSGIGCVILNDLPSTLGISIKITFKTSNVYEKWVIDDIRITGRPLLSISQPSNVTGCVGSVISGVNEPIGTKFTWTNSNPSIGLAASGFGNVPSFTAVNTSSVPQTATITITPSKNKFAFVTNQLSDSVKIINQCSNSVISAFSTGNNSTPEGMVVAPDDSFLFVACPSEYTGSKQLTKYNINTQTAVSNTYLNNYGLSRLAYNQATDELYSIGASPDPNVNQTEVGHLGQFNVNDMTVNSHGLGLCRDIAVSPDGTSLYVITKTGFGIYSVAGFSLLTGGGGLGINDARAVTVSPDGSRVYVADYGSASIKVIDPRNYDLIATIPAGFGPVGVVADPKGRYIYVTDSALSEVICISTSSALNQNISTGTNPAHLSISSSGDKIYVPNYGSNDVMIYNTNPISLAATISNIGNGPYMIKTSGYDGNAVSYTITVYPTPTLSSSLSQTRCNNQTATYTATSATPGTTFTWSRAAVAGISNAAANGTGAAITETLTNTTVYTLFVNYAVTITANGCSNTQNVMVIVNALSAPSFNLSPASPSICPGNSIVINASNASHTYSWTPATALNATTGISVTANPITSTVYTVTATGTNGCTNTKTANVTVSCPKPSGMVANSITNNSAQLNWNAVACALSFKIQYRVVGAGSWININNVVDTFRVLTGLTASTAYEYQIATKCPNGTFGTYSAKKNFTTPAIRIGEQVNMDDLNVFPNPTSGSVTIQLTSCENCTYEFSVFDILGQTVYSEKGIADSNLKQVDLSNLATGIYQLKFEYNGQTKNTKLVIQ